MTPEQLAEALDLYALCCPEAKLIRHNENITYQVNDASKQYVLRIHRPVQGFSLSIFPSDAGRGGLIQNELELIWALKTGTDLPMQSPVRGKNGGFVQMLADGTPVTLLEWVDGQTLDGVETTPEILKNIGKMTARMHAFFLEDPKRHTQYSRYCYDQTILPPIAERIYHAAQSGTITQAQAKAILGALEEIRRRFDELDRTHQKCIVHADLAKSNMILNSDGEITPIDFSLCGYSHIYMDIGGLFGHINSSEDRKYILEGYKSIRGCEIDPHYIEPYFALQVILFIACQHERAKDWDWFGDAMDRWCRDIFDPLTKEMDFLVNK